MRIFSHDRGRVGPLQGNGGRTHWFEMSMDAAQISERRVYMRNVLQNHGDMSFLSADALDGSRLYRMVNGYIYENADGYEFFLSDNKVTQEETEFRRIPFYDAI